MTDERENLVLALLRQMRAEMATKDKVARLDGKIENVRGEIEDVRGRCAPSAPMWRRIS